MSDWLGLALLAIGFYLYECCTWTPSTVFACFKKPFRRSWMGATGTELIGNESGGFAFSDPLTLSGNLIHCSSWPIAVSPDGICLDAADAAAFWTFDDLASISSYERTVRFNGAAAFDASSSTLARQLALQLDTLRQMPITRRAAAIRAAVHESFDPASLDTAWSRSLKSSRALTILAAFPLIWLAAITPAAFLLFGPLRSWPYVIGGLFLTSFAVSMEFIRVHRAELPGASDRWLHVVSMTLFPIAAIRAADRVSRERVAHFNPAAVVGLFCKDAHGDSVLRRLGFDLRRGLPAHDNAAVAKCRGWYRAEQQAAFTRLMKSLTRDPFGEPERIDAAMIAYCPRCHSQYGGGQVCPDCEDVALMAFDAALDAGATGRRRRHA